MAGKLAYGLLFTVLLPVALVAWAKATAKIIHSPTVDCLPLGIAFCSIGAALIVSGWIALWVYGRGLPINIAPPPRYVTRGIYRLVPHPIYLGFSVLCAGVSILTRSASGLWLVTPFVILGSAALVLGYEVPDLAKRFGEAQQDRCRILPADAEGSPAAVDRWRCYLFVLLPWLALYECVLLWGVPGDAMETYLPFERRLSVAEWSELFYVSTYVLVLSSPLVAKSSRSLRKLCVSAWLAMAIVFPIFLAFPFIASPKPFAPQTILGRLLAWERGFDSPVAALPAFHVIWAILAMRVFQERWGRLRWLWRGCASAIALSCLATGMHSIADVVAGVVTGLVALHPEKVWGVLRGQAERIANSWQEWRIGKVRVINHGAYAGLGAFCVLAIAGIFAGPGNEFVLFASAMCGLVGSALWAQFIEGSPRLLRPYGFYGGLLGATAGVALASFHRGDVWLLLGALCVGGPWVQAIGRLRCLVQGCCHGRLSPDGLGIRYQHPKSRVFMLEGLHGLPLYPTPLYSILWNVCMALAMWRLWKLHYPLHFIGGVYLLLNGLGRFVEEAYRGEPQTPVFAGLRLYQWIALATILAGALLTALGRSGAAPVPEFHWQALGVAAVFGVVCWIALGVDFPDSNRRLARLTM
jgi:prolipoprotein diacylglyceryltransferase/protein-S-isoprenylcysteine O-methyltransferase Ste14